MQLLPSSAVPSLAQRPSTVPKAVLQMWHPLLQVRATHTPCMAHCHGMVWQVPPWSVLAPCATQLSVSCKETAAGILRLCAGMPEKGVALTQSATAAGYHVCTSTVCPLLCSCRYQLKNPPQDPFTPKILANLVRKVRG
jgi:hypothetical protein